MDKSIISQPLILLQSIIMFISFLIIWFLIMWYVQIFEEQLWIRMIVILTGIILAWLSIPETITNDPEEQKTHLTSVNSIAFTIATVSLGMTYLLQSNTIKSDDIKLFYPLILLAFVFSIISVIVYNGKYIQYQILVTIFAINLSIGCLIIAVVIALHSLKENPTFQISEY